MSSQTRCPTCQTIYPMPAAKLGDPNARAKCGQCQQVFFLNANLIPAGTPTQIVPPPQPQVAQPKPQAPQQPAPQQTRPAAPPQPQAVAQQPRPQPTHTRCPTCQTIYPMPAAKLGDPNARAKCGQCQQVFLLNDNLVPVNVPAQPQPTPTPQPTPQTSEDFSLPTVPRRAKRVKPTPTEGMIHDEMEGNTNATPTPTVDFSDDELDSFLNNDISFTPTATKSTKDELADNEGEAWINDLLTDKQPVTSNTINKPTAPVVNNVDLDAIIPTAPPKPKKPITVKQIEPSQPTTQQLAEESGSGGGILWFIGCLLMVVLLGVQYALFNTDKLARSPESAGLVRTICGIAPCKIPSADLSSLNINADLQNQKDVIIIIKNNSGTEQLFPYLLVQLKDDSGKVVADFVADTKDYLDGSQTTLLAGQHKRVMLSINKATSASSVKVTPFYQ